MKKMMIAAAVAAMGAGVFAQCAEDPTPAPCTFAYKVTLSGKTIASKTIKTTVPGAGNCVEKDSICMAVPGSFKRWGYVYGTTTDLTNPDECETGCGCNDFSALQAAEIIKKTKTISPWTFELLLVEVIGTKQNQVQVFGTIDGVIDIAGQGKIKKGTISSVKGNFTGLLDAPVCTTCTYDADTCDDICDDKAAQAGKLCEPGLADAVASVVYGKWSMKASKAMAKKLAKDYKPQTLAKGYTVVE